MTDQDHHTTDTHPMPPPATLHTSPDRGAHCVSISGEEPRGVMAYPVGSASSVAVVTSLFDTDGLSAALVGSAFTQEEMVQSLIDVIREGTPDQKLKAIKQLTAYVKDVLSLNGHVGRVELQQQEHQDGSTETLKRTTRKVLSFEAVGEKVYDVPTAKGIVRHDAADPASQ